MAAHLKAVNLRQLWDVLVKYCSLRNGCIVILDALDECGDISRLLPDLIHIPKTAKVKVIFTSRREPELKEALQGITSLAMDPEHVQDDIRIYLNYRVAKSSFLSDPRVRSRIIRILNTQHKGMFLWVRLMVDELESCVTITQVEDTLASLTEGLLEVYKRIIRRLHLSLKRARRDLCSRLLKWLVLARRPLHLREVNEVHHHEYAHIAGAPRYTQNLLCSERDVESICGSLVVVKKRIIELIHLSAKEFLLVLAEASILSGGLEDFLVEIAKGSADVAGSCVTYLKSKDLAREISPTNTSGQALKHCHPFVGYACLYCISHSDTTGNPNCTLRSKDLLIGQW